MKIITVSQSVYQRTRQGALNTLSFLIITARRRGFPAHFTVTETETQRNVCLRLTWQRWFSNRGLIVLYLVSSCRVILLSVGRWRPSRSDNRARACAGSARAMALPVHHPALTGLSALGSFIIPASRMRKWRIRGAESLCQKVPQRESSRARTEAAAPESELLTIPLCELPGWM